MKKNKGFTLIELLAVIVVLAIIALIATPIVMNTISSAKKGAAERSATNYIKQVETAIMEDKLKNGNFLNDGIYTVNTDGNICLNSGCSKTLDINMNGNKPEKGEVGISKAGNTRLYVYINGYCITKEYDSEIYITKMDKEACGWYATDNYETIEGTTFTIGNKENNKEIKNYLIYGNSTQNVRSGKNLVKNIRAGGNTTLSNGSITTGALDVDTYFMLELDNIEESVGQTVTLSFDVEVSKDDAWKFGVYNGRTLVSGEYFFIKNGRNTVTFTLPETITSNSELTIDDIIRDKDIPCKISNIQVEVGSQATSYEEYGVSPSVDYPSEIKNVGDLITNANCNTYGGDACNNIGKYVIQVKASKKNLFNVKNISSIVEDNYSVQVENNNIILNGTRYDCNTKVTLKELCPFLKVGDIVTLNFNTTSSRKFIYLLRSKVIWKAEESRTITEDDLNSVVHIYNESHLSESNKVTISNIQIEKGDKSTSFEEYVEPKITNIYLDEPLRKVGDAVDYIDFHNKRVVRNVKVEDSTNTKTIEESYSKLETPIIESINLPNIGLLDGYNSIEINTNVQPSNVILTINK